jgi:hypothetical protein
VSHSPYGLYKNRHLEKGNSGMTEFATGIAIFILVGTIGMLVVDYVSRRGV